MTLTYIPELCENRRAIIADQKTVGYEIPVYGEPEKGSYYEVLMAYEINLLNGKTERFCARSQMPSKALMAARKWTAENI